MLEWWQLAREYEKFLPVVIEWRDEEEVEKEVMVKPARKSVSPGKQQQTADM